MSKRFFSILAMTIALLLLVPNLAQGQTSMIISKFNGGPVGTSLGPAPVVGKDSFLERQWFVMNDPGCPLELKRAGVMVLNRGDRYWLLPSGTMHTKKGVAAFEVRFMLFDLLGRHIRTLAGVELRHLSAGSGLRLKEFGPWKAWGNDEVGYVSSVGFVARVKTADGVIWVADTDRILREARYMNLDPTEESLLPTQSSQHKPLHLTYPDGDGHIVKESLNSAPPVRPPLRMSEKN